ncbi:hypothetical protein [Candidatus Nardonella dryophthoridicola]|uniref:hypothetical protein n=1 Tax=Candidatus Nardonella dryophthoridicola TaxID=1971485 RepID=UPI001AD853C0|nr:hypothetical protein [Candidatus Nardonella dryophthoridicola]QTJ62920.1 hypothetical protein JRY34_00210 [Candidatus Nardonella dryophthoridicola]
MFKKILIIYILLIYINNKNLLLFKNKTYYLIPFIIYNVINKNGIISKILYLFNYFLLLKIINNILFILYIIFFYFYRNKSIIFIFINYNYLYIIILILFLFIIIKFLFKNK